MPGTELAFAGEVVLYPAGLLGWKTKTINPQTAIFRQVNKEKLAAHHDALEFPDGRIVLLDSVKRRSGGKRVATAGTAEDRCRGAPSKSGSALSVELTKPQARHAIR